MAVCPAADPLHMQMLSHRGSSCAVRSVAPAALRNDRVHRCTAVHATSAVSAADDSLLCSMLPARLAHAAGCRLPAAACGTTSAALWNPRFAGDRAT